MTEPTKHTPGPWQWFGTDSDVYLATTHSGRRYVMGFRRMGLQGAQPTFQIERQGMVPASELVEFEVGEPSVRGFAAAKKNPSVYRYDVNGIDHPDARLIAAAPELLEALRMGLEFVESTVVGMDLDDMVRDFRFAARAAIAKAEGRE